MNMSERRMTTIRLFGVNITVEDQNDHHSPVSQTDHQAMITTDETSRKRKLTTRSPTTQEDQDSSLPKKPKILRLFGVDIPIDHLLTTTPKQDHQPIPQNPNQEVQEEEAAPAPIPPQFDYEDDHHFHPVFLFEKELTSSDVVRGQNRLLITRSDSLMAALTEEERGRVEGNGADSLKVVTRDTNGVEYTLRLKRWASSGSIIFKHEWGKLVRANGLQTGDSVEGWGYRRSGEFRLALNIIRTHFY